MQNYIEVLLDEVYNEVSQEISHCMTESCIYNIKAMTLNKLDPKYFLFEDDEGMKKAFLLDPQIRISVLAKLTESIQEFCNNCEYK